LLADGRLRHIVDLGGFGKTLRLGEIAKNFQTLDLHKNTEYLIRIRQSTNVFLNIN
jgi:hypothetical protein